jgi:hypothetical protein
VRFYTLFFEIDHEANMLMVDYVDEDPHGNPRSRTYWQKKDRDETSKRKDRDYGTQVIFV